MQYKAARVATRLKRAVKCSIKQHLETLNGIRWRPLGNGILREKMTYIHAVAKGKKAVVSGRKLLNKQQSRWWCHLANVNEPHYSLNK